MQTSGALIGFLLGADLAAAEGHMSMPLDHSARQWLGQLSGWRRL
jgi:hypothetical protein